MPISKGFMMSLNNLREKASQDYKNSVIEITEDTDIGQFASPIINDTILQNEFISSLIQRIVYTAFEIKNFNNPLRVLEGDKLPLGQKGQEIYVNPADGKDFDPDDFAGLLKKYESDVKVQYMSLNLDRQYPATINRQALKKAFVSWGDLESFVDQLSNSLYNGAYIDQYQYTKNIVAGAYKDNKVIIEKIDAPSTDALAKKFITKARELYLNFQTPSSNYNSWNKCGGYGRPIITWTQPENIVFLVRNDIRAFLDVNVLAQTFNIDKAVLLGNIITVDNFDFVNKGTKVYDGSKIIGFIGDKSWFRIKEQDMFLDNFYNPSNRTMQYFLNLIKMYNFSLFANGVCFATDLPVVPTVDITLDKTTVAKNSTTEILINVTPVTSTKEITAETSDTTVTLTVTDKVLTVKTKTATPDTFNITLKSGNVTKTIAITATANS